MSETFREGSNNSKKNNHFLGLIGGIGTGIVAGLIMAGIGVLFEDEYTLVVILCLMGVGYVVSRFVPNKSPMGAITGGLSCAVAFFAYQIFLGMFGFYYEDNSSFWFMLAVAVVYGGVMGYKGKKGFEEVGE